jgi:hypothetical protein
LKGEIVKGKNTKLRSKLVAAATIAIAANGAALALSAAAALAAPPTPADPLPANCSSYGEGGGVTTAYAYAWCDGGSSGQFRVALHCNRAVIGGTYWHYGPWRNVVSTSDSYAECSGPDYYMSSHVEYR